MRGFTKKAWALLLTILLLFSSGCGAEKELADKPDTSATEPLEESTVLPEDGVITAEQMATIAEKDQDYTFTGTTEDGISYVWTYNGKLIKNPQEQRMKVTVDNNYTEDVKKAANDAQVGLGITLESMDTAAPATLKLTLTEKWDADSVIYCKYQDGKALRIGNAEISTEEKNGKEVTSLSFSVPETGDTYYLVGGNTKAGSGETEAQAAATAGQESQNSPGTSAGSTDGQGETSGESQTGTQTETSGQESQDIQGTEEDPQSRQETIHTCTISIECSTILDNWGDLNAAKAEFVPADGWILYPSEAEFTPGETAFEVLKRVCKDTGIQISSRYTPMYGSYYVEGINQLYEFDCGQNSGWMYRVNGWYPNYGCSSYELSDGDNIEWKYTCDLGSDVGGGGY